MYWGIGNAKIVLTEDGNQIIMLPDTNNRNVQPYEMVHDTRINPLTKQVIQRIFGFRATFRLSWVIPRGNELKLRRLLDIANRTSEEMEFYPHYEIEHIVYTVIVTDVRVGYSEKTTMINEIEIELTAVNLIDEIPNYNIFVSLEPDGVTI